MDENSQNMVRHLGRLSDIIFAVAMALTIFGFQVPESASLMSEKEANDFLFSQVSPLINYAIAFITVAFYWIDHVQKFKYYRKTNEFHIWLYLIYLMCFFPIPYLTDLTITFEWLLLPKIFFSCNITLMGLLSFFIWFYATHNHKLVDTKLDAKVICATRYSTLVEPLVSLISIGVAFVNQSLWDWVWFLLPIPYFLINKIFDKSSVKTLSINSEQSHTEVSTIVQIQQKEEKIE